jgi:hypothetical protein
MEISNTLVDLGVIPTRGIPQLLKSSQQVFTAAGLILERMREEHASGTGP